MCLSTNSICYTKSRRMKWPEQVIVKERDHLEDLGLVGRIILK